MEPTERAHSPGRPTIPQVYALVRELCDRSRETFRTTRAAASLIERLRTANGKGSGREGAPV